MESGIYCQQMMQKYLTFLWFRLLRVMQKSGGSWTWWIAFMPLSKRFDAWALDLILKTQWDLHSPVEEEIQAQRWKMICLNAYSEPWHKWGKTRHPAFTVSKYMAMDQIMGSHPCLFQKQLSFPWSLALTAFAQNSSRVRLSYGPVCDPVSSAELYRDVHTVLHRNRAKHSPGLASWILYSLGSLAPSF